MAPRYWRRLFGPMFERQEPRRGYGVRGDPGTEAIPSIEIPRQHSWLFPRFKFGQGAQGRPVTMVFPLRETPEGEPFDGIKSSSKFTVAACKLAVHESESPHFEQRKRPMPILRSRSFSGWR
jgi:hypothetical protein